MKTKRIKIPLPTINSRDEAESVMNDIACIANNQRKLAAQRDAQVLRINEGYEFSLAECSQSLQIKTESLRAWAEANPDQFPKGRKSIDMLSGVLGFRTGTPKLALISRLWNWERVLSFIKLIPALNKIWVRVKEEVDKDAIIGAYSQADNKPLMESDLRSVGLKIVQEENFFIEPKLTEVEVRQSRTGVSPVSQFSQEAA